MLKIGEKIKELRKAQDVTQEKLADYLNISYQAVSKWENGLALPDLSLIPALSNFFGVSADYLLGITLDKREEEIKKYIDEASHYSHTGELDKGIQTIRDALQIYPNNHKLLSMLVDYLYGVYCIDHNKNFAEELIKIAELILIDCTDEDIRIPTLELLAYTYNCLEQQDKAIETANKLPSAVINRNHVLSNIIMPMSERKKKKQECLLADFEVLINNILWLGGINIGRKQYAESIEIYQRAITLILSFANEGFFLLRLAGAYSGMAMAYSGQNNTDEAYRYIDRTMETYRSFEEVLLKKNVKYQSPILNELTFSNDNLHANIDIVEYSEYADWYHRLREVYDCYDAVRKDERFEELCVSIEKDIEHYKTEKRKILK